MGNITPSVSGDHLHHHEYFKGKKYEPSQKQIDLAYTEMKATLKSFTDRWGGCADMNVFAMKLVAKFREEYPEFFVLPSSSSTSSTADDEPAADVAIISSPTTNTNKRRNINGGPIILRGLRMPREVVGNVLSYCDRPSVNNFSLTCRGALQVIQDRKVVKVPWPNNCPWPRKRWVECESGCEHGHVVSRDASRFAVIRGRRSGHDTYFRNAEIWDRFHGLIGEVQWEWPDSEFSMKPVFSPDGELLLVPLSAQFDGGDWYAGGVQAVQLPSDAKLGPIVVSGHPIPGSEVSSVAFIDNATIVVFQNDAYYGRGFYMSLWTIERANGRIALSFCHNILEDVIEEVAEDEDHPDWNCKVTTFKWGTKHFLATNIHSNCIVIHDLINNESLPKSLPDDVAINDLEFLQNGKLVVSLSRKHSLDPVRYMGGVYIYDCKVNTVQEIENPKIVSSSAAVSANSHYRDIVGVSADGTKVAFNCRNTIGGQYSGQYSDEVHILDLKAGAILSDPLIDGGGGDSSDRADEDNAVWTYLAWNSLVN